MKCFLYIVACSDGSLYTGITKNLERRIYQHNERYGKFGAKSLKGKLPVKLVYTETYEDIKGALRREYEIKGWKREKKLKLILKGLPRGTK